MSRRISNSVFFVFWLSLTLPALAASPIEEGLAATFRVASGSSSGTCFFVTTGNDSEKNGRSAVLVTAAHALDEAKGAEMKVVLRSRKDDASYERREWSFPIRKEGQPLWKKHKEVDVAAIRIELPEGVEIKPFGIEQLASDEFVAAGKVAVGDTVFIPGFPAKLESNDAGWPVLRRGTIASHPLWPTKSAKTILVNSQTWGGDSGAPVLRIHEGKPYVVGLVQGMQRQTDHVTSPFEEQTIHTPLGLAIVVQAAFIREVVEAVD